MLFSKTLQTLCLLFCIFTVNAQAASLPDNTFAADLSADSTEPTHRFSANNPSTALPTTAANADASCNLAPAGISQLTTQLINNHLQDAAYAKALPDNPCLYNRSTPSREAGASAFDPTYLVGLLATAALGMLALNLRNNARIAKQKRQRSKRRQLKRYAMAALISAMMIPSALTIKLCYSQSISPGQTESNSPEATIPEPSSFALLVIGLAGFRFRGKHRPNQARANQAF